MSGIFISYRREDSAGGTGRLSEHLKERFGADSIFMDIDTIEPGVDFTEALKKAVNSCDVLLAIIGPKWATATNASGTRRLEDPADWVRTEIATVLTRKIRVIPVLVGGASPQSSSFPMILMPWRNVKPTSWRTHDGTTMSSSSSSRSRRRVKYHRPAPVRHRRWRARGHSNSP